MPRRHTLAQPYKPFLCGCGERRPHMFPATYKSICTACRNAREAARLRSKTHAVALAIRTGEIA